MASPSRKQLVKVITGQRRALRNMDAVLRGYRAEIVRLGGDPSKVRAIPSPLAEPTFDDLKLDD